MELNLDSEGGIPAQQAGIKSFLADSDEDRHRKQERGAWEDSWAFCIWESGEVCKVINSPSLCGSHRF